MLMTNLVRVLLLSRVMEAILAKAINPSALEGWVDGERGLVKLKGGGASD